MAGYKGSPSMLKVHELSEALTDPDVYLPKNHRYPTSPFKTTNTKSVTNFLHFML